MNHVAVIIASSGRPDILRQTLESLLGQSRMPDEIVVSVPGESDFRDPESFVPIVRRVLSEPGASVQRNRGIDALKTRPLFVAFVDDDMVFHVDYLKNMEELFAKNDKLTLVMGHLLANGNVTSEKARELVDAPPDQGENAGKYYPSRAEWGSVYGCNMCVRFSMLEKERFDERLPLYSVMEDVDFGTRARRHGEVGYFFGSMAVHLRASAGRVNQRMLGFAEVMNPAYLARKGTVPRMHALWQFVIKRPLRNFILMFYPKQSQRRRELFAGNLYALWNIIRGKLEPERMLDLR
ncbi:MAG: glycosyltransferase [Chthoniobacteraceae bacterium]